MKKTTISQKKAHEEGTSYQFIESLKMGPFTSYGVLHDPIHTSFVLSRYKFCARMLTGKGRVLEIGCGDAPGTPIVAEFVDSVLAIDWDDRFTVDNTDRLSKIPNITFETMNFCEEIPEGVFDAIYAIDVIEHLDPHLNQVFMKHITQCLHSQGVCIIGTPNKTADKYASPQSKSQHINQHTHVQLKRRMQQYFHNVFLFSMNDEVVHTGFGPMAHYLFAMGVGVRKK